MNKIIFDFEGKQVELEASFGLVTVVASNNSKFSFNNENYVVDESIVVGIEQSAENLKKKMELLKDPFYKGDLPYDVVDLLVKMKRA